MMHCDSHVVTYLIDSLSGHIIGYQVNLHKSVTEYIKEEEDRK